MPYINEYTAQADALRPVETGVEAWAGAGRRLGAFANQAAESIKGAAADQARAAGALATAEEGKGRAYAGIAKSVAEAGDQAAQQETHREVSHGAAALAQLHSDLTDQWNEVATTADPRDTSVAAKFRETALEPALEQFTQSFSTSQGQQWAENHAGALRAHMFEKQSADMASRASDAVTVDVRQMTNAWTNTARKDPSATNYLLDTAESSIAGVVGSSPNLKGADAARLHSQVTQKAKEDIVRAGALGAIEKSGDPEGAADAFAKRYPQYINAQEIDQLAKAAKTYKMAANADAERSRRLAKQQADDKSELQRDKYLQDIFGDDPKTTLKQVLGDQSLVPKDREHLIGVMRNQGKVIKSDPDTVTDLKQRLLDPDKPTTIFDVMRAAEKLNDRDFTHLAGAVKLAEQAPFQTPLYKASMKDAFNKIGTDEVGREKGADFAVDFMAIYDRAQRAPGGAPPDALDLKNPDSLISKAMKPYMRTAMERARDRALKGLNPDAFGPGGAHGNPANTTVPAAVPAPKDREAGKVYPSPMGPMRWTGTGWVSP